jgi:1-aminocyclopropane-1-carboxylate deaminase/D-cysteine desulfhydrase-like pyridoxal-dependent ACC family enzyme
MASPSAKRIAIVGSRDFQNLQLVDHFVASLPADTIIVSGGARGVDRRAEEAAKRRGLRTIIYHADWETHGKAAGYLRNQDIVDEADEIVAFWDGVSNGTWHSINLARKAGKKVFIISDEGEHGRPSERAPLPTN